jgi:hypothetical protein
MFCPLNGMYKCVSQFHSGENGRTLFPNSEAIQSPTPPASSIPSMALESKSMIGDVAKDLVLVYGV